jgi:hypothetical protein
MMKKIFLLFLMLVGALSIHADDAYPYLTFETTDGAKASVAVDSLTLSVKGTTLTAGDKQFTLSNLSKMYFSTEDETTAGIREELSVKSEEIIEVYDLQGKRIGPSKSSLKEDFISSPFKGDKRGSKGIYIVRMKDKTYKLMVR